MSVFRIDKLNLARIIASALVQRGLFPEGTPCHVDIGFDVEVFAIGLSEEDGPFEPRAIVTTGADIPRPDGGDVIHVDFGGRHG